MEHQSRNSGAHTFLEHWGVFLTVLLAGGVSQLLMYFINLNGTPWICLFATSAVLLVSGAALILYAKISVYRRGEYFTFGSKSVPPNLAGYYRWGWRVFLFGVVLSLCLLLSKP